MQIHTSEFDDHCEPNAEGLYEWRYVGTQWVFVGADAELCFRRYRDEPQLATLVSPPGWRADVFASSLFKDASAWLREHEGVDTIQVYNPASGTFAPFAAALAAARARGLPTGSL